MTTLTPSKQRTLGGHADRAGPGTDLAAEKCPWCSQSISRDEYNSIRNRIAEEERARVGEVEKDLTTKFAREKAQAETQAKIAIERAKRDAAKVAETKLAAIRSNMEATVAAHVEAERQKASKRLTAAVAAEKVKWFDERARLTAQLGELQQKLERKPAYELGEPAETSLFEALRQEFPADRIERVGKGVAGADILHDVIANDGTVAGRIVYDSKCHRKWQSRFVTKLRQDMIDHNGDHAILSTSAFPAAAGDRELIILNGVIVSAPMRVPTLAHLLRRQVLVTHSLRLGNSARAEKRDRLYDFLCSEQCAVLLDQFVVLTEALTDLESREVRSHQQNWSKRAELIRSIKGTHDDFAAVIARIIGGDDTADEEVAA